MHTTHSTHTPGSPHTSHTPHTHHTVQACVLFNIGALYSQLAAKVDRGSVEGRAEAVDLLEKAVGMFEYVRDKFSNAPSKDLSPDMLSMLADLMRVCVWVCVWVHVCVGVWVDG